MNMENWERSTISFANGEDKALNSIKILFDKRIQKESKEEYNEGPLTVDLQPTSICPQRCVHCSHMERNKKGHEWEFKLMNQIHDDFEKLGVGGIIYSGGG